jgi:hypothetical protein
MIKISRYLNFPSFIQFNNLPSTSRGQMTTHPKLTAIYQSSYIRYINQIKSLLPPTLIPLLTPILLSLNFLIILLLLLASVQLLPPF